VNLALLLLALAGLSAMPPFIVIPELRMDCVEPPSLSTSDASEVVS
jgi:hypothetical protein